MNAEKQNREILQAYDKNHSRFNWEITARQAQCTLSARELKYFKSMLQYNLEDRAQYLMNSYPMSKMAGQKSLAENRRPAYTYGLMLENLYKINSYDLTKRNLISCIEASFTSEMVREYMQYRYQPDETARERSRMRLVSFLGNAFSGEWLGSMISEIRTELLGKTSLRICKFGSDAVMSSLDIRFSVLSWDNFGGDEEDWRNVLNDWFEETGIMEVLECIDMFFVKREGGHYEGVRFLGKVEMARDEDVSGGIASETKDTPVLKITADGSCALDILGFIPKSMDYRRNRERVVENAVSVIKNALNDYLDSRLFQPGEINRILKMIPSLAKKYGAP